VHNDFQVPWNFLLEFTYQTHALKKKEVNLLSQHELICPHSLGASKQKQLKSDAAGHLIQRVRAFGRGLFAL